MPKMKEIVKEHPLRPIILQFDLNKKPLDFERRALDAYYRSHDRLWEVQQKILQHKRAVQQIEQQINEIGQEMLRIRQQTDFLEDKLHIDKTHQLPEIKESFSIDIVDYYAAIDAQTDQRIALREEIILEIDWYNEWADYIYEHENWQDEEDEEGDRLMSEVFRHYNEVSVDIISLDRDRDEFHTAFGVTRRLQQVYFDYAAAVFDNFDDLQEACNALQTRALRIREVVNERYPR